MNSLERVITALTRRQPDRVPFFECVIDQHVMEALLPGCDYFQFNDWIGLDNVGQNRSSWSRENVQFIDESKGLFRDKWGEHASNNLANRQLILDKVIPRARLRPGYGQGWRAG